MRILCLYCVLFSYARRASVTWRSRSSRSSRRSRGSSRARTRPERDPHSSMPCFRSVLFHRISFHCLCLVIPPVIPVIPPLPPGVSLHLRVMRPHPHPQPRSLWRRIAESSMTSISLPARLAPHFDYDLITKFRATVCCHCQFMFTFRLYPMVLLLE